MTKTVENYYREAADNMDYLKDSHVFLGKYGRLALDTLKELNPGHYVELGVTGELEEWVETINNNMINQKMNLMNQALDSNPVPAEGSILDVASHRNQLSDGLDEVLRDYLVSLIPQDIEVTTKEKLPF